MRLQGLLQPLIENEKFIDISMGLKTKTFPINIVGLSESGIYTKRKIFKL